MNTKRLCLFLLAAALTVTTAAAQSKHGWGNKTVNGLPGANINKNGPNQSVDDGPKDKIEGTWRATETFPDASVFKVLFTFSAGRDDKSGTAIHSDELYFTGGPSCFPSQGVWKRTGDRTFIATDEGFCFDPYGSPIFAPAGKILFKSAVTLNRQGTSFDGTMSVEAFDVNGISVFTANAILHGDRMLAEGP
jgi:hypothetical protein